MRLNWPNSTFNKIKRTDAYRRVILNAALLTESLFSVQMMKPVLMQTSNPTTTKLFHMKTLCFRVEYALHVFLYTYIKTESTNLSERMIMRHYTLGHVCAALFHRRRLLLVCDITL
ncbi:hypothetical protein GJ496_007484 [Pomphorhynchus laevis]|nr:hypothetical protein GJ496_007484 [Pomphorhynchus laevis]